MNRSRLFWGLALSNLGIFVLTTAFLPPANEFMWYNNSWISWYVNSRTHWEIAWLVLAASSILTSSIYLIVTSLDRR